MAVRLVPPPAAVARMVLPALLRLAALTAGRSAFPRNALSSSTTFALFCSLSPLEQLRPATESGQTVYALSSGAGVRAGVSVIRVSGPDARLVLERMCPGNGKHVVPQPRRAVLRSLRWPAAAGSEGEEGGHGKSAEGAGARQPGELIDKALVLWFEGPNSFTGEDTVELHTHGSPAVVSATLEGLSMLPGLRLAEPGEFTRQVRRASPQAGQRLELQARSVSLRITLLWAHRRRTTTTEWTWRKLRD